MKNLTVRYLSRNQKQKQNNWNQNCDIRDKKDIYGINWKLRLEQNGKSQKIVSEIQRKIQSRK